MSLHPVGSEPYFAAGCGCPKFDTAHGCPDHQHEKFCPKHAPDCRRPALQRSLGLGLEAA